MHTLPLVDYQKGGGRGEELHGGHAAHALISAEHARLPQLQLQAEVSPALPHTPSALYMVALVTDLCSPSGALVTTAACPTSSPVGSWTHRPPVTSTSTSSHFKWTLLLTVCQSYVHQACPQQAQGQAPVPPLPCSSIPGSSSQTMAQRPLCKLDFAMSYENLRNKIVLSMEYR